MKLSRDDSEKSKSNVDDSMASNRLKIIAKDNVVLVIKSFDKFCKRVKIDFNLDSTKQIAKRLGIKFEDCIPK